MHFQEISTNEDNFGNLDQLLDDDLHAISPEHYDLVEAGDDWKDLSKKKMMTKMILNRI